MTASPHLTAIETIDFQPTASIQNALFNLLCCKRKSFFFSFLTAFIDNERL